MCIRDSVRVELWEPAKGKENEFSARKFIVSAEISEVSGDTDIQVSGNLNAVGDPIDGTFNKMCIRDRQNTEDESLILVALLHDLCKTYYYSTEMRNKKDENGKWIQVPFYTVNDKVPYGDGEKPVMMIEEYIKLKPVERYAIRWHMGFSEPKELYGTLGEAIKKYPICLAIHEADLEATYLMESDNE